jgi:3-deoxy-manno-octulosonate cytidylyltransferase (CMP-KDO synthetase)
MEAVIVIPARYGSTRFPGKPLAMIQGLSLLSRTWQIAKAVRGVDDVYVATDDERIADHAIGFGGKVQMTSPACANGTERILQALHLLRLKPAIVINLQGDALLTPPKAIEALVNALKNDKSLGFATLSTRLQRRQYEELLQQKSNGKPGGTLVTVDRQGKALYFSKSIIPYVRNADDYDNDGLPVYRHIGLYGYRYDVLEYLVSLEPTPLELAEGLEQLRALENGIAIKVVEVDYHGRTHWSVDSPEDAKTAEQIILREGEILEPRACSI